MKKTSKLVVFTLAFLLVLPASAMYCLVTTTWWHRWTPSGVTVLVTTSSTCWGGGSGGSGGSGGGGSGGGGSTTPSGGTGEPCSKNAKQFVRDLALITNYTHIEGYGIERDGGTHRGTDLFVPNGTPVYAPCSGTIADLYDRVPRDWNVSTRGRQGRIGNRIVIEVDESMIRDPETGNQEIDPDAAAQVTLDHLDYGFVSRANIKLFDHVVKGDLIGWSDNTGDTNVGPHVHVEIKDAKGNSVDPKKVVDCARR